MCRNAEKCHVWKWVWLPLKMVMGPTWEGALLGSRLVWHSTANPICNPLANPLGGALTGSGTDRQQGSVQPGTSSFLPVDINVAGVLQTVAEQPLVLTACLGKKAGRNNLPAPPCSLDFCSHACLCAQKALCKDGTSKRQG